MKIRHLGHSCVEIIGEHHILIDPDFTHQPLPDVEYICISHAHKDHVGRITEVPKGTILASPDVCEIVMKMGVSADRFQPITAGENCENIEILPGYSVVKDWAYLALNLLFRWRFPEPGGTPLSFYIHDEADLLHIGDAHQFSLKIQPDILCLPWRKSPIRSNNYQSAIIETAKQIAAPYILPIHYDLPGTEADPMEISQRVESTVLIGEKWHVFKNKKLVEES